MAEPVDRRVDTLEGECKALEKSTSGLGKAIEALTKATDTVRNDTTNQFAEIDAQFGTINKAYNTLRDRVIDLEDQEPPSDSNLQTFKKVFASCTKQVDSCESYQAKQYKELSDMLVALDKKIQDTNKKITVIETHGGGV